MAGFIQILPDPLYKEDPNITGNKPESITVDNADKYKNVRRPVRGLQIKEETFGTLEVKTKSGKNLLLIDSGGSIDQEDISFSPIYSNFLLQSVSESVAEKSQIVETFGPAFVFFFGTRPRMIGVQGVLLNSADFNWKNEFWYNYENYLRGTRLVASDTIVHLSYDDVTVMGYIISADAEIVADPQEYVTFRFQMLVSQVIPTNIVGSNKFPYTTPVNVEPDVFTIPQSEAPNPQTLADSTGKWTQWLERALSGDINFDFTFGPKAQNYTNYVNQWIQGANIRIPQGYEGSALSDGAPVKYRYGSSILSYSPNPVKYGKIRDNEDEYIARVKTSKPGAAVYLRADDTLKAQYEAGKSAEKTAREQFKKYNINPDPPPAYSRYIRKGVFTAVQIAGRMTLPNLAFPQQNAKDAIDGASVDSVVNKGSR